MNRLPVKLQELLTPEPNTGCWLYTGARLSSNGYARVWWERREQQLHRVVYKLLIGPIPSERPLLDHGCCVRACANPFPHAGAHGLEPVTVAVNTHRGSAVLFRRTEDEA